MLLSLKYNDGSREAGANGTDFEIGVGNGDGEISRLRFLALEGEKVFLEVEESEFLFDIVF